jgi:para-nitrobenzyl esterase
LDLPFVFGHLKLGPEFIQVGLFDADNLESYAALSDAMMSYWAEFARSGDPAQGAAGLQARWSAWGSAGNRAAQTMMLLDSAANGGSRMSCDTVTKDQLLIELETDPRIASQEERCRLLRDLTTIRLGWRFTNEDYTGFMGGICARSMPL